MAFDIITPVKLGIQSVSKSPTVNTIYTVMHNSRVILKDIDIVNTNAFSLRVTVYLVPSGASPSISNQLIPNILLKGYTVFQWSGSQVLNEGDSVRVTASSTGVTVHASGGECV